MKFRYYITDLFDGSIKGSNDEATALNYAGCSDFFVVDSETGDWILEGGERTKVKEIKSSGKED